MVSFNIPLLMVTVFLLLTLSIGIVFSKKTTTLREYAVGNKQFSTATLVATMLATAYGGGGLVRTVEQVHQFGLYWIIKSLLAGFGIFMLYPLALRMGPFMQHLSMPETLGHVYGRYPRIVAALSSICTYIASLAIQINIISLSIRICIQSDNYQAITILSTLILIVYSTFGGIRSVTFTDVLQFITFAIIIPMLACLMFEKTGKTVAEILPILQTQSKFQLSKVLHFDMQLIAMLALLLDGFMSYVTPTAIQRAYMCTDPIQAKKVFVYSGFFYFLIKFSIILLGIFVFVGAPDLGTKNVWGYIMANMPPIFQGLVAISLLSMAMSTADSKLNVCSIMISHDIWESIQPIPPSDGHPDKLSKEPSFLLRPFIHFWRRIGAYAHPLRLARLTSIIVGLLAMTVAFYYKDLLALLKLTFVFSVPIITAPFILAIFGFRGTSRTALIGMAIGVLSILAWKKWIEPGTGVDGSFPCMLANGLAMMANHYLSPQPLNTGWIGPDDEFKQIQQAEKRKKLRRNQAMKSAFSNRKSFLASLYPSDAKLASIGIYIILTSFISFWHHWNDIHWHVWPVIPILIGASFVGYMLFFYKHKWPKAVMGAYWLIGVAYCLPIHTVYGWWHSARPLTMLILCLAHVSTILWAFPLYPGICLASPFIVLYPICCLQVATLWTVASVLLPLLMLGMVIFAMILFVKHNLTTQKNQLEYFKNQQKIKLEQKIKNLAYQLNIFPNKHTNALAEDSEILEKVVNDVTQSITFIGDSPLYKEDFQSIINKFSQWTNALKQQAKSKDHILLQAMKISLEELINQVELALEKETNLLPRILIEQKNPTIASHIVGDRNQIIYLLVTAILKMEQRAHETSSVKSYFMRIQLYNTKLYYHQGDSKELSMHNMHFPALAIIISQSTTNTDELPSVKDYYTDVTEEKKCIHSKATLTMPIDLRKKNMERIIRAHYGYLDMNNPKAIVIVLPCNVHAIREEMIAQLPIETVPLESALSSKEMEDSLIELMEFHDYVCNSADVDPSIIAEILLLLRRCYGSKKHASGQLFYLRAAGIAKWVATWIFHSPKPIYAALLYDLIRYTRLPLSYIKANYDRGIFCFVQNVLSVDQHQAMSTSLFHVHNRFKRVVDQAQLSVLYIKLAERLYDLGNAKGYSSKEDIKYIAQETLTVDVELAYLYLDPEIASVLEVAAQQALAYYESQIKVEK